MRPEAPPGTADVADHLALRDLRAAADGEARLVGVSGREAVAVVDQDQVAVASFPPRVHDRAGRRRADRRPVADADVDPFVHPAEAAEAAVAERADDGAA